MYSNCLTILYHLSLSSFSPFSYTKRRLLSFSFFFTFSCTVQELSYRSFPIVGKVRSGTIRVRLGNNLHISGITEYSSTRVQHKKVFFRYKESSYKLCPHINFQLCNRKNLFHINFVTIKKVTLPGIRCSFFDP